MLAAGLVGISTAAFAQEPLNLVPSIGVASTPAVAPRESPGSPQRDVTPVPARSVQVGTAQWSDFPVNRRISLTRAGFDQSGYHLTNTAGVTINVPFANQNLHVMKFAVSTDNTTFFVNDGTAPVLYIPVNSCLYNSNVSGIRWYPFSTQFRPARPVFLGVAPNYTEFVSINWYPNTITYGGYYGVTSFIDGGIFRPTAGLTFYIGTQSYGGWSPYRDYVLSNQRPSYRPRGSGNRPRDYADNDRYNGNRNNNNYGNSGYQNQNGGYNRPNNGYTFSIGGYGFTNGGYGFSSGGYGFSGGGYGYPGGGASSGTSTPPATQTQTPNRVGPTYNRVGPTFDRVGPRFYNDSGFPFGYPRQY